MIVLQHRLGASTYFCAAFVAIFVLELLDGFVGEELSDAWHLTEGRLVDVLLIARADSELLLGDLFVAIARPKLDLLVGHVGLLDAQLRILMLSMAFTGCDRVEARPGYPLGLFLIPRIALEKLFGIERLQRHPESVIYVLIDAVHLALLRDIVAFV